MTGDYSRLRRAFVALLVLSLVAQATVGTAAAQTAADDCDPEDTEDLVVNMVTAQFRAVENALDGGSIFDYNGGIVTDDDCFSQSQLEEQTKVRAYQAALGGGDISNDIVTIQQNHVDDSRTFASTIAKREILVGIENGDNLSTIEQNVNESIEDYYTTVQINVLNAWRTTVNDLWYTGNISEHYGVPQTLIFQGHQKRGGEYGDWTFTPDATNPSNIDEPDYGNISTYNTTLLNGSTHPVTRVVFEDADSEPGSFPELRQEVVDLTNNTYETYDFGYDSKIWARYPTSTFAASGESGISTNATMVLDENDWRSLWVDIENASTQMKRNYAGNNGVAEQAMDQLNASEFDASEFVDANTLATQFSTNYESTGYYGWRGAEAALLGWNGTLNDSFSITYDEFGTKTTYTNSSGNITSNTTEIGPVNMTGVLYTNWVPNTTNGSFVVGETYNTSNADSPVYFINQSTGNTTEFVTLNGTFTINELTNVRTGNSINSTTLEQQHRQTTNVSLTVEEMRRLIDLEEEAIQSYDTAGGGGGGGGWNFGDLSLGGAALAGLLALGGAILVLDRTPGSGS